MATTPEEQLEPVIHRIASDVPIEGPKAQHFVDPQSLKIPRRLKDLSVPATPFSSGIGNRFIVQVPESAIWEVESIAFRLNPTATVGARTLVVEVFAAGANLVVSVANDVFKKWATRSLAVTAGQTGRIYLSSLFNLVDTTAINPDTVSLREPFPLRLLTSGWTISARDAATVDAADTISCSGTINEYVSPRGLAIGEIPMGLESGFMWDLADPRKVN